MIKTVMSSFHMVSSIIKEKILLSVDFLFLHIKIYSFHISFIALLALISIIRYAYGQQVLLDNVIHMIYYQIESLCIKHLHTNKTIVVAFFFSIFLYVSILNLLSVFGFYSINANPIFTLTFSIFLFFIFIVTGIFLKQHRFILDLCPANTPVIMKPLIILLEFISICLKPISSSIRLILNVLIGHICVHILEILSTKSKSLFILSFFIAVFIKSIEMLMSLLQAYIFTNMFILLFKSLNDKH